MFIYVGAKTTQYKTNIRLINHLLISDCQIGKTSLLCNVYYVLLTPITKIDFKYYYKCINVYMVHK